MNVSLDTIVHGVELVGFVIGAVKGFRVLDRFYTLFKDYPPHRHINGKILFPSGYEPPTVEKLDGRNT
jgi:hypothetical protein